MFIFFICHFQNILTDLQVLDHLETTYNFEVEDNHNYYVSEECILVHNEGCSSDLFDHKANADEIVKYYSNGPLNDAFHQNSGVHKGKYNAKDLTIHGHNTKSKYKLLKKVKGNKLELVGDLDKYGIFMTNKTQVTLEKNMNFFKRRKL